MISPGKTGRIAAGRIQTCSFQSEACQREPQKESAENARCKASVSNLPLSRVRSLGSGEECPNASDGEFVVSVPLTLQNDAQSDRHPGDFGLGCVSIGFPWRGRARVKPICPRSLSEASERVIVNPIVRRDDSQGSIEVAR